MKKRNLTIRLLALCAALCMAVPVTVSATEPVETAPAPEPRVEAVHRMEVLPGNWSPLSDMTPEKELILSLTADRLYDLAEDGQIASSMATALPVDVTESYAGTYGIPENARRGYAYLIDLDSRFCWEDGMPINADDWLFTMMTLMERGKLPFELANQSDYLQGATRPSGEIISLMDAGFSSVSEAKAAGYTEFFVDTTHYWGLNDGWQSASSRTRLKDRAIPSGVNEMYVSGAYLYDRYLRSGGLQSIYQSEFVGIATGSEPVTLEDVGLVRMNSYQILLILDEPTVSSVLALKLGGLVLLREELFGEKYATSPETYSAYGPYRVVSAGVGEILLERNEAWAGDQQSYEADTVRFTP